jgi:hypothetical protein
MSVMLCVQITSGSSNYMWFRQRKESCDAKRTEEMTMCVPTTFMEIKAVTTPTLYEQYVVQH